MKLLLDTHIWIWALHQPDKLSRAVRRELTNPKHELYLSPISIWEARHLVKRGKLKVKASFSDWLAQAVSRLPLQEAPFNFAVADQASAIELPQGDVGDVFLAATASVFGLTLVTADEQLIACGIVKTLGNV